MNSQSPINIESLLDEFNELDSWDDRCDALIDHGLDLPDFPESQKTESHRVHGCQSNVWMLLKLTQAEQPETEQQQIIEISADSDAIIVRGLIAVLLATYSGRTPKEILEVDIKTIFSQLHLDRHLSPMRKNGLNGMVKRIRDFAIQSITETT